MTLTSVYEALNYHGDVARPKEGQHDLRALAAEVVHRLPDEVRDWLLDDTNHVFIGGSGQWGEFFDVWVHPTEFKEGFACLRVVFLSEQLMAMPKGDALFVIAHEIAHSWLGHGLDGARGGDEAEAAADAQAVTWGFPKPSSMADSMTAQDDPLKDLPKTPRQIIEETIK